MQTIHIITIIIVYLLSSFFMFRYLYISYGKDGIWYNLTPTTGDFIFTFIPVLNTITLITFHFMGSPYKNKKGKYPLTGFIMIVILVIILSLSSCSCYATNYKIKDKYNNYYTDSYYKKNDSIYFKEYNRNGTLRGSYKAAVSKVKIIKSNINH